MTALVEENSEVISCDLYCAERLTSECRKLPSWMFHDLVHNGRKVFGTFLQNEYGTVDSTGYDEHILSQIEVIFNNERANSCWLVFQHDNAPRHES